MEDDIINELKEHYKVQGELELQQTLLQRNLKKLLARGKICPFCEESIEDLPTHIEKVHKKEIKIVLKGIDKEKFFKIRKELIADSL